VIERGTSSVPGPASFHTKSGSKGCRNSKRCAKFERALATRSVWSAPVRRRFSGWKGDQMWNEDLLRPDVLPHKAGASSRTYSSPEVIDSWRGVPFLPPRSQLSITSAAAKKCLVNNPLIWLNRKAEHAGLGRRIPHSSALTLFWRVSLQALRLVAKEYSEPFACKLKTCRDELYKSFHPTGTACSAFEPFNP
jgi:hypothetical protein